MSCLDFLARHDRRVVELSAQGVPLGKDAMVPHVEWLQPFPDRLLELNTPGQREADAMVIRRETIELAFVVALQYLRPKQRAVLILRDVLEWSAQETATLLDSSVASVNAALQRARATLKRHQPTRDNASVSQALGEDEMHLVKQYAGATERLDTEALTRLLRDDARFSMPPSPNAWVGNRAIMQAIVEGGFGEAPTTVNASVSWPPMRGMMRLPRGFPPGQSFSAPERLMITLVLGVTASALVNMRP